MTIKKTSKKESVWFDENTDDTIQRIAAGEHTTVSDVIRKLVDKGMKTEGYKVEDDRLYDMVKTALVEISKPQVERLAAISAKATQISAASYFLLFYMIRMMLPEDRRDELDDTAATARKLGIEMLKLRDKDIDAFIRSGIERIKDE